ncbi:hypothetical protein A6U85_25275 [Agrobacterium sp. 13-626]|nr:hypothetical protein A6U85_25275 [Agrobacterium sp. 13-626]
MSEKPQPTLQTLDRGILTLQMVARTPEGTTVAEIAHTLGVHRAIAYRIVATLEAHGMVSRSRSGRVLLGIGIPAIAHHYMPQFKSLAQPLIRELAQVVGATTFVAHAEGTDCVAFLVEEPEVPMIRVGYRVGSRHPLDQGAAGIAILAGRQPHYDDSAEVKEAREKGYSLTRGMLQRGAVGVAVPLQRRGDGDGEPEFSIGVVAMEDLDIGLAIGHLKVASGTLASAAGLAAGNEAASRHVHESDPSRREE